MEKNKSCNQIKMCTFMDMVDDEWWMKWKLLLYDLSSYVNSLDNTAIFLFLFLGPSCVQFFLLGTSCVHIFFDSPCLFCNQSLERETNIYCGAFICRMDGWYNANFA
jgi:hypothetical protein